MENVIHKTDFIVVGSGIAGLRAAIDLSRAGRVTIFTKAEITESNSMYAQGGIAAVLSGIRKYADARVHADALKELTQSFQAEVAPQAGGAFPEGVPHQPSTVCSSKRFCSQKR